MTQLLTGHGCCCSYLCRYTLEVCPAWDAERREPRQHFGNALGHSEIFSGLVREKRLWTAFFLFAETIMGAKENAEWLRERS